MEQKAILSCYTKDIRNGVRRKNLIIAAAEKYSKNHHSTIIKQKSNKAK